jgi:hypothetical protein
VNANVKFIIREKVAAIIGIVLLGVVLLVATLITFSPPTGPDPDDMPIGVDGSIH